MRKDLYIALQDYQLYVLQRRKPATDNDDEFNPLAQIFPQLRRIILIGEPQVEATVETIDLSQKDPEPTLTIVRRPLVSGNPPCGSAKIERVFFQQCIESVPAQLKRVQSSPAPQVRMKKQVQWAPGDELVRFEPRNVDDGPPDKQGARWERRWEMECRERAMTAGECPGERWKLHSENRSLAPCKIVLYYHALESERAHVNEVRITMLKPRRAPQACSQPGQR